jgi:hypothetical protein
LEGELERNEIKRAVKKLIINKGKEMWKRGKTLKRKSKFVIFKVVLSTIH